MQSLKCIGNIEYKRARSMLRDVTLSVFCWLKVLECAYCTRSRSNAVFGILFMRQMRMAGEFPKNLEVGLLWSKCSDVFRQYRQGARAELSRDMYPLL